MPPLTPPRSSSRVDCAGESVTPSSVLDGASRRLAYSGKLSASCDGTAHATLDQTVVADWQVHDLNGSRFIP